jgi:hypothetical protein
MHASYHNQSWPPCAAGDALVTVFAFCLLKFSDLHPHMSTLTQEFFRTSVFGFIDDIVHAALVHSGLLCTVLQVFISLIHHHICIMIL